MTTRAPLLVAIAALGVAACVGGDSGNGGNGGGNGVGGGSGSGGALDAGGTVVPGLDASGLGSNDATIGGACASGTACSDGKCHDLANDDANCGACGKACGAGEACRDGACGASCGAGLVACGGACVDPTSSSAHCGASGDCSGAHAGVACASGQACVNGQCATLCGSSASTSIQLCGGVCTDTDFDPANCGGCGKACNGANATTTSCANGQCGAICKKGFGDCNADPSDGCETNLETSAGNCGACGAACSVGACTAGACAADPEWLDGPPVGDFPDAAAYVIEHGGRLTDVDGGAADAAIADAAIDPSANGASIDASACAVDDAGKLAVDTTACGDAGTCDDVVFDQATGLLWQRFSSATSNSLADAECYCAGLRLAGLSGWRVPTRLELVSLIDLSRVNPALNFGAFPTPTTGGNSEYYLTSSVSKPVPGKPYVWEVNLGGGDLFEWGAGSGQQDHIRCVR